MTSNFQQVVAMNEAFNNPKGNPLAIDVKRLRAQCSNIVDETGELFVSLGASKELTIAAVKALKAVLLTAQGNVDITQVRDALGDIHVFAYGAHHFMGIDADRDMKSILDGVMTRFVKDESDLEATIKKHASKGITDVYLQGKFPTMIVKSGDDQPDAPKGKFLKSASYKDTVFYPVPTNIVAE